MVGSALTGSQAPAVVLQPAVPTAEMPRLALLGEISILSNTAQLCTYSPLLGKALSTLIDIKVPPLYHHQLHQAES